MRRNHGCNGFDHLLARRTFMAGAAAIGMGTLASPANARKLEKQHKRILQRDHGRNSLTPMIGDQSVLLRRRFIRVGRFVRNFRMREHAAHRVPFVRVGVVTPNFCPRPNAHEQISAIDGQRLCFARPR